MTRTTLTLSLALALSLLVNVLLWRRGPAPAAVTTIVRHVPAEASRTVEPAPDLRDEVRRLKDQLALAQARRALDKRRLQYPTDELPDQPEARELRELLDLVTSFIEMREIEIRDIEGGIRIHQTPVLTPEHRREAFRVLEGFLGLTGAVQSTFRDLAESAVAAYARILGTYERELAAARKAGENDEFFEDEGVRNQKITDRFEQKYEEWTRDRLKPLQDLLGGRDGVRPALLSDNLADLLTRLGTAGER